MRASIIHPPGWCCLQQEAWGDRHRLSGPGCSCKRKVCHLWKNCQSHEKKITSETSHLSSSLLSVVPVRRQKQSFNPPLAGFLYHHAPFNKHGSRWGKGQWDVCCGWAVHKQQGPELSSRMWSRSGFSRQCHRKPFPSLTLQLTRQHFTNPWYINIVRSDKLVEVLRPKRCFRFSMMEEEARNPLPGQHKRVFPFPVNHSICRRKTTLRSLVFWRPILWAI